MDKGHRIKIARERSNMTQTELGLACGTTKQTIFKYESGIVTNIPTDRIERIAEVTGVSPAYIMGWADSRNKKAPTPVSESGLSTEAEEVAQAYDMATEKEQRTVRVVLSDYLPDGTAPKEIAAHDAPKPLIREDVAQVIHPETSAELP